MQFNSLKEFYSFYLTEHSNKLNRILHFIGTSLMLILLGYILFTQSWRLLPFIPVVVYSFAWFGHFFIEKNKPAAFKNPFYSVASDLLMWFHILSFQIEGKLAEAKKIYPHK